MTDEFSSKGVTCEGEGNEDIFGIINVLTLLQQLDTTVINSHGAIKLSGTALYQ
jgi:hypothetical protein